MTSAEFWALLMLATAVSFTPGPNTTLSTAIAANRGLRPALRFVLAVPVHIYLGTLANPGTFQIMVSGMMPQDDARKKHPKRIRAIGRM